MIHVGTAGFSYKDWVGPFYPNGTKTQDMLVYYSTEFNFTEINSTYYHMPSINLFNSLDKKTPEGFKFSVKINSGFTHERVLTNEDAHKFKYSLNPIQASGKLLNLLVQFPYSFHVNDKNYDYLKTIKDWFKDYPLSIEFRNSEWINKDTVAFLRKEHMGIVCVDEPDIKGLIGRFAVATSKDISYIRLHGRNKSKWYSGEGSERYDYLYSKDELTPWIPRIMELNNSSENTVVSFNNHPIGKAIENARMIRQMMSEAI